MKKPKQVHDTIHRRKSIIQKMFKQERLQTSVNSRTKQRMLNEMEHSFIEMLDRNSQ